MKVFIPSNGYVAHSFCLREVRDDTAHAKIHTNPVAILVISRVSPTVTASSIGRGI